MDRLAQFGVSKSFGMEVEKLLALVHHLLEKGRAAHFEITFHHLENQFLKLSVLGWKTYFLPLTEKNFHLGIEIFSTLQHVDNFLNQVWNRCLKITRN